MTTEQKAKAYDEAIERSKEWYNPTEADSYTCIVESIFSELKENEDEQSKKWILEYLYDGLRKSDEQFKDHFKTAIAWLEKQNFNVANEEYWRGYNEGKQCILDKYAELQKQGEQKSTDKFKVGDWVVYNNDICQIVKREEGCNKLVTVFGIEKEFVNERNLSTARLWTIRDARAGDILSGGTTVFIFKDLLSDCSVMSYCDYDTDSGESDAFCPLSMNLMCSKITPATKEQRDALMKAMTDAGYVFDFKNKELKKIEYSPAEEYSFNIESELFHQLTKEQQVLWRKEIEQAYNAGVEASAEWSEEDEANLNEVLSYIKDDTLKEFIKSLRPQKHVGYNPYKATVESIAKMCDKYENLMWDETEAKDFRDNVSAKCYEAAEYDKKYPQWKPTEEQIYWLEWVVNRMADTEKGNEARAYLEELLEQIKQL